MTKVEEIRPIEILKNCDEVKILIECLLDEKVMYEGIKEIERRKGLAVAAIEKIENIRTKILASIV